MLPKISIVIPTYNDGRFIERCILSITCQEYSNLELIVIDGGSTDDTVEIIKKFDKFIFYWVSEKDRGQSHAINKGFKICTGEIITFFSSDDIYVLGSFDRVIKKWEKWKDFGIYCGGFQYIDENDSMIDKPRFPFIKDNGPKDLSTSSLGNYRLHQVSTFYTSSALDNVGRYVKEKYDYVMDRELLFRVVSKYSVFIDNSLIAKFRLHSKSKSSSKIIEFHDEFHSLYLDCLNGNISDDNSRVNISKAYLYKGNLKYAIDQKNLFMKLLMVMKLYLLFPRMAFKYENIKRTIWLLIFKKVR